MQPIFYSDFLFSLVHYCWWGCDWVADKLHVHIAHSAHTHAHAETLCDGMKTKTGTHLQAVAHWIRFKFVIGHSEQKKSGPRSADSRAPEGRTDMAWKIFTKTQAPLQPVRLV